jgi:hypothetical protein
MINVISGMWKVLGNKRKTKNQKQLSGSLGAAHRRTCRHMLAAIRSIVGGGLNFPCSNLILRSSIESNLDQNSL